MTSPLDRTQPSQPSDRRMRASRAPRSDRRMQTNPERLRRNRIRLIVGLILLLVIAGVVGYGYYDVFVAPTRVLAARVGDVEYTQGDLVKRVRLQQAASFAAGSNLDMGRVPFEVLLSMAEAEMIRRAAPGFNVHVTEAHIEAALRDRFGPAVVEGQEVSRGQLDAEYRENYQRFLSLGHLSDKDYKRLVEESLYKSQMRERLSELVPSKGEQVEVHWIKLPSREGAIEPEEVRRRLDEEDFAAVAQEVSVLGSFANRSGYVGWVPKGAFPLLDPDLFGDGDNAPLPHGEISGPRYLSEGIFILKVTGGPEEIEISENMKERLKDRSLDNWLSEQKGIGTEEGWWEVKFNSEIYDWVVEQVRQLAPPPTPLGG